MAIAEVTAALGENKYTIDTIVDDAYEIDVASPLATSTVEIMVVDEAGNSTIDTSQVLKVIGEWNPPKIDWSGEWSGGAYVGDYFTYVDYNRIINNLLFIAGYATQMYKVSLNENLDEKEEADFIYADEINKIEDGLEYINSNTYMISFSKKVWKENGNVPSADDWNRIEKLQLDLYNSLMSQREAQNRLAYDMGGQRGFKV